MSYRHSGFPPCPPEAFEYEDDVTPEALQQLRDEVSKDRRIRAALKAAAEQIAKSMTDSLPRLEMEFKEAEEKARKAKDKAYAGAGMI
jgi:hypothetical protein